MPADPARRARPAVVPDPAAPAPLVALAAVAQAPAGGAQALVVAVAAPLQGACPAVRAAHPRQARAAAAMPRAPARRPEMAPPANPALAIWPAALTCPRWSIPCPPSMRTMVRKVTAVAPRVGHPKAVKRGLAAQATVDRLRNHPAHRVMLRVSKVRGPAPVAAWNQTWVPAAR